MKFKHLLLGISALLTVVILSVSVFKNQTFATYNALRPIFLNGGGEACIKELNQRRVEFTSLGDTGSAKCPVINAVKISMFKNTIPSSPFVLSCMTALNLDDWLADNRIKSFTHMGTINCRKMRGRGLQSEHSYGTAIDISMVDGASVRDDWGNNSLENDMLREFAKSACKHFSNVLTPDTNKLHRDHFHFDNGFGSRCGTKMNFNLR